MILITLASALALGSLHALEADHMAAVTSFAVQRPRPRAALMFGVRWAVGHGGAILLVGATLFMLGLQLPEGMGTLLERCVGVVMIGLGVWTFRSARALHAHTHRHADGTTHAHLHSHAIAEDHDHRHAAAAVGLLHGLAGSGSAVALIPLVAFDQPVLGVLYLACFTVGTVVAMALYALLAGFVMDRAAIASERLARNVAAGTGIFAVAIGCIWLLR